MITIENFRSVLDSLGFTPDGGGSDEIYHHTINSYELSVNFSKGELKYPKDIKTIDKTTSNFSHNENFVVFECICRLLQKGYKAESLEIEPKWKLGREGKSGKADILVKDADNNVYLIIECKTAGSEYEKELKNMQNDGGQLFSYFWQERNAKFLCLYASDFSDKLSYQNAIISVIDDDEMISREKITLTYQNAKNAKECVKVWQKTYKCDFSTSGIFEAEILPYEILAKAKTYDDLDEFDQNDNSVYNKFATILRKHNISGKENAFDKLVNLFLCKIYDELNNKNELKFIYRPRVDSFEDLQDRLMQLYQKAMEKFLAESITFVSKDDINHAFNNKKSLDSLKREISEFIRQLKFYSNNDFAFLEVHNKELFYQNALVLVDVVKLFENYKLTQNKTNQFLGNLFELFLQKGMKQDEGQFFTPIQICEFIAYSLPIKQRLSMMPKLIDFACGAGHFLNTYANFIKNFITDKELLKAHYTQIYGIEKEYRLSKVAKVSSAMYGQKDIQIAYFDALLGYEFENPSKEKSSKIQIKNNDFDILIANPPYSVKGFLKTISENSRQTYELFNSNLNTDDNNAIECFFIERANQLLKQDAIVAIILPSSILNKGGIYEQTRQIILKNFSIKSIVELGPNTFGATGTNTIILFMQKRKNYKNDSLNSQLFKDLSDQINAQNLADNSEFYTNYLIEYCEFMNYGLSDFKEFLNGVLSPNLQNHSNFKEYYSVFLCQNNYKNLINSKEYKTSDYKEQENLENKAFLSFCDDLEREKLLYFALCKDEKVLIVKSPSDNKEEKKFLGYEWSNRKGAEGLKELNTPYLSPLFERENFDNENKLAFLIRQNFLGNAYEISDELKEYAFKADLIDLINFNSSEFNKAISLNSINSSGRTAVNLWVGCKFELVKLDDIVDIIGGLWAGKKPPFVKVKIIRNTNFTMQGVLNLNSAYPELDVEVSQLEKRTLQYGDIILEKSGGSSTQAVGRVVLFNIKSNEKYSFSNFTNRLRVTRDNVNSIYLYFILNFIYQNGITFSMQNGMSGIKNLDLNKYRNLQIPLPPLKIQQKIVNECENAEKERAKFQDEIKFHSDLITAVLSHCGIANSDKILSDFDITDKDLKTQISSLPTPPNTGWEMIKLGEICMASGGNGFPKEYQGNTNSSDTAFIKVSDMNTDINSKYILVSNNYVSDEVIRELKLKIFPINTIVFPKVGMAIHTNKKRILNTPTIIDNNIMGVNILEAQHNKINNNFLFIVFDSFINLSKIANNANPPSINNTNLLNFKIPLPPPKDQEKIVAVIENLENKIEQLKSDLNAISSKNQEILQKYLFSQNA